MPSMCGSMPACCSTRCQQERLRSSLLRGSGAAPAPVGPASLADLIPGLGQLLQTVTGERLAAPSQRHAHCIAATVAAVLLPPAAREGVHCLARVPSSA